MMSEKGYQYAEVTHTIKELPGGPKLVHLTFNVKEGPKVKIKRLDFDGNKALSDGELEKQMKENKPEHWLSWITGRGTYQEAKFEEDADRITENYRNKGYISARIGTPEIKILQGRQGREDALHRAEGARHRRRSLSRRQLRVRRQHGRQVRSACASCSS